MIKVSTINAYIPVTELTLKPPLNSQELQTLNYTDRAASRRIPATLSHRQKADTTLAGASGLDNISLSRCSVIIPFPLSSIAMNTFVMASWFSYCQHFAMFWRPMKDATAKQAKILHVALRWSPTQQQRCPITNPNGPCSYMVYTWALK